MASQKKQLKMINFINHRMRVDIKDGRTIVGQMLGFDRHMNMVLADAEELRRIKRKGKEHEPSVETEEKRTLGFIILRGQEVVAAVSQAGPPADPSERLGQTKPNGTPAAAAAISAPGISRPAGRGAGLQGPAAGVGGPGFGVPFQGPPGFGGPGFGRGFPGGPQGFPPGAPGFAPGGPQGFPPGSGFPPPGGRGFPPGGFQGR